VQQSKEHLDVDVQPSNKAVVLGMSYTVGARVPLAALPDIEQAAPEAIASLQARGLHYFRDEARSMHEVLLAVASSSLESAGCVVSDIDGILMVNSPLNEELLVKTLSLTGFERTWLLGLSFQDCGGCEAAMRVAGDLVRGAGRMRRLLVVLYGKVPKGESRIGWGGETVFSDGAAACVVSCQGNGLEIVSSEVRTNPKLPWIREVGSQARYFEESLASMAAVSSQALRLAGIAVSAISRVFATNGSSVYHGIIASAIGVPPERIHTQDMADLGHVFSCDGLIGLQNYISARGAQSGEYFMLVSWSPFVFGATVLRQT
jgi:3-oxoacyl-[acyl-carrier-protein] synthase III